MEFRKMRRSAQELSRSEAEKLLKSASHGVLAVSGDGGYPYAVPMSFAFEGGKIYLHSAAVGHKIEAIRREPKVSFCVVTRDSVIPEKYTTAFESVIVFGRAEILEGDNALAAMEALAKKYHPNGTQKSRDDEISGAMGRFCAIAITPEHISGKIGRELLKEEGSRCRENSI